jgi:electron-transferring-flavoprotein dehydrogenase
MVLGAILQQLISKLHLREEVGAEHQTYGLGLKEVWEVNPNRHREGLVEHMIGFPLDSWTYGGGYIYHMSNNRVSLGFVVGLDYWNTYLSPFHEFQQFKNHPYVRRLLEGGTCLEYGARSLNEGKPTSHGGSACSR